MNLTARNQTPNASTSSEDIFCEAHYDADHGLFAHPYSAHPPSWRQQKSTRRRVYFGRRAQPDDFSISRLQIVQELSKRPVTLRVQVVGLIAHVFGKSVLAPLHHSLNFFDAAWTHRATVANPNGKVTVIFFSASTTRRVWWCDKAMNQLPKVKVAAPEPVKVILNPAWETATYRDCFIWDRQPIARMGFVEGT